MTNYSAPVQARTLVTADAHRERWTKDEIEFVVEMTEIERDEDIAIALGRSLYAIWNLQHRVRTVGVEGVLLRLEGSTAPAPKTCSIHNLALTATGECDWC